jgi:formate dehydrogenase maturation protein FdhE
MNKIKFCQLCGSEHNITFHHLIPKTCHSNKWFKKNFSRDEMRHRGIDVCRKCHSYIHQQYNEKYLGRELNTLSKLLSDEKLSTFIKWAKKHH